MPTPALYFLVALASSLALTPICRMAAQHFGFTAKPQQDRWHQRPTALLGGVAIALPTLILGATIHPIGSLWPLISSGAVIACVGFLDDVISIKPSSKLIGQVAVASALLFLGYRLGWTNSLAGDAMLTLFWLVGITNAFNLLDNMDGLCAGIALVTGGFVLFTAIQVGAGGPGIIYLSTLLGATAGFLVYNFHPASIFMGDAGSLFLGLNLAALTLITIPQSGRRSDVLSVMAAPVLLLLIPIFDTTLVTVVRLMSGRKPSQGGRDHSSHRLVAVGLSQRSAVTILWLLAGAGGAVALSFRVLDVSWGLILAAGFLLAMIIFAVYLARVSVYDNADLVMLKEGSVTPLVVDFMYKRRVAEVVLDLCLIPLAYYIAYRLRFDGLLLQQNYPYFLRSLPVVLSVQLLALFVVGGYRGAWRYFGIMDAVTFAKGVFLGTIVSQLALLYVYRFESYSRAVFVIYAAFLMLLLSGSRASFRLVGEFVNRRLATGARLIVYGTDGASPAMVREAFGKNEPLRILGFIDDNRGHQNLRIGGYAVLGDFEKLTSMINGNALDCVVLNTRLIDVDRLRTLEALCQERNVRLLHLQFGVKPFIAAS